MSKDSFICYKQFSSSNISALEFSTALMGKYCNRKRVGKPLSIGNQERKRIERSASDTESPE